MLARYYCYCYSRLCYYYCIDCYSRLRGEAGLRFRAIPPVGSAELQERLLNEQPCARCGKYKKLAINFVLTGRQPHMKVTCTCGHVQTSSSTTNDTNTNSNTTAGTSGSNTRPPLAKGDSVTIHGLQSPRVQDLNGLGGVLVKYLPQKDRWQVRLDPSERTILVKPANLL